MRHLPLIVSIILLTLLVSCSKTVIESGSLTNSEDVIQTTEEHLQPEFTDYNPLEDTRAPGDRVVVTSVTSQSIDGYYDGESGKIDFLVDTINGEVVKKIFVFKRGNQIIANGVFEVNTSTDSLENLQVAGVKFYTTPASLEERRTVLRQAGLDLEDPSVDLEEVKAAFKGIKGVDPTYGLSLDDKEKLNIFARSEAGRAILEVPIYINFHESDDAPRHLAFLLTPWNFVSSFYPTENRKLKQPPGTLDENCPLKCEVLTVYFAWGCEWDGQRVDFFPLLDGPPRGCLK
jgi:hypothetical protein